MRHLDPADPDYSNCRLQLQMEDQRQVIGRLCAAGKTTKEDEILLQEMYGSSALKLRQIQRIYRLCAGMCADAAAAAAGDQRRLGASRFRPARDERTVALIRDAVSANPRATLEEMADCAGTTSATTWRILTVELGMKKLEARWVPKDLSEDMKKKRVALAQQFLRQWAQWRYQIITCDETHIKYDLPMTPRQCAEWRSAGDGPPETPRLAAQRPGAKILLTVFFDAGGVIFYHFNVGSVNAERYIDTLRQLRQKLRQRRGLTDGQVIRLHHDNAPPHTTRATAEYLAQNGFEVVAHPPYSPDLAPCDFYLVGALKAALAGRQFTTPEAISGALTNYFRGVDSATWRKVFDNWVARMEEVIQKKGNYL